MSFRRPFLPYAPHEYAACCDRCESRFYMSDLRLEWDKLLVCPSCFEERQPQDYIQVPPDSPAVTVARPDITATNWTKAAPPFDPYTMNGADS